MRGSERAFNPIVLQVLIRALPMFVLLALPWPGIGRAYCEVFCGIWTAVLGSTDVSDEVRFELDFDPDRLDQSDFRSQWIVEATAKIAKTGRRITLNTLDVRRASFIPTAVYLALIAVAIGRVRGPTEIALSGLGLVALQFMPAISILRYKLRADLIEIPSSVEVVLTTIYWAMVASPYMTYAIPAILWIVLHWRALERLSIEQI